MNTTRRLSRGMAVLGQCDIYETDRNRKLVIEYGTTSGAGTVDKPIYPADTSF